MKKQNVKYNGILLIIALGILFYFDEMSLFNLSLYIAVVFKSIPASLMTLLPGYKKIKYYHIINKVFDYSGNAILAICILRLIYKITTNS